MPTELLFATRLYRARLSARGTAALNAQILREAAVLQEDDGGGQRWSRDNYPGGYTSYGSVCRLQTVSPTFARLERLLAPHVSQLGSRHFKFCRCIRRVIEFGENHLRQGTEESRRRSVRFPLARNGRDATLRQCSRKSSSRL